MMGGLESCIPICCASRVKSCRIGTTIAKNALLEGRGEKFALLTTKGSKDVCTIGDQTRPRLFELNIKKAEALHALSVEIDELPLRTTTSTRFRKIRTAH
jgi:N-methylhydantoinase A/oxoprolinase/acetone carboxylase beta subunit